MFFELVFMIQHLLLKKSLRKIYVLQHKSHSGCAAGYRLVQLCCRSGVRGLEVIWLYGYMVIWLYGYMVGMAIAIKKPRSGDTPENPK